MVNIKKLEAQLERERIKSKKRNIARATKQDLIKRSDMIKSQIKKARGERFDSIRKAGSSFVSKGGRIVKRTGRGAKVLAKKSSPIIKKQIKLIAEQQRREAAFERKIKKTVKKKKIKPTPIKSQPFISFDI